MIFKPQDFTHFSPYSLDFNTDEGRQFGQAIANRANAIFNEWLEKQSVVHSDGKCNSTTWWVDEGPFQTSKLKARLVCIEEIKGE